MKRAKGITPRSSRRKNPVVLSKRGKRSPAAIAAAPHPAQTSLVRAASLRAIDLGSDAMKDRDVGSGADSIGCPEGLIDWDHLDESFFDIDETSMHSLVKDEDNTTNNSPFETTGQSQSDTSDEYLGPPALFRPHAMPRGTIALLGRSFGQRIK